MPGSFLYRLWRMGTSISLENYLVVEVISPRVCVSKYYAKFFSKVAAQTQFPASCSALYSCQHLKTQFVIFPQSQVSDVISWFKFCFLGHIWAFAHDHNGHLCFSLLEIPISRTCPFSVGLPVYVLRLYVLQMYAGASFAGFISAMCVDWVYTLSVVSLDKATFKWNGISSHFVTSVSHSPCFTFSVFFSTLCCPLGYSFNSLRQFSESFS